MKGDNDIKIFGAVSPAPSDSEAAATVLRQVEREKQNGNLGKARRLGARLAEDIAGIDRLTPAHGVAENAALLTQRRILMAFAAEVGLDAFLPNNLVAQEAQNTLYNNLHLIAPAFYDELQNSGAFSFYTLCLRDSRQAERQIAETFARLCGMAGSDSYARMGAEAYTRFMAQIKQMADAMQFVKSEEEPA
ncbi:MAG: hypothetical protein ACOYJY_07850 [Acutalibacteraceae bacterium]|jgi:hypothetical protein